MKVIHIYLLIFLLHSFETASQKTSDDFNEIWNDIVSQDDFEKNYRFSNLVESLKNTTSFFNTDSLDDNIPDSWSYVFDEDINLIVIAGVLPYEFESDRLIWLAKKKDSISNYKVFYSNVTIKDYDANDLDIRLNKYFLKDEEFVSLKILFNSKQILSLEDIYTKIIIQDLVESSDDDYKIALNSQLINRFDLLLSHEPFFENDFSYYDRISTLKSADEIVKIVTWNLEFFDGSNSFSGLLAIKVDNSIKVYKLVDDYSSIDNPEYASLTVSSWFGAVYYDILEHRYKKNTYYTLLGYNPNDVFSKYRIIEVMSLSRNGVPRFNNSIFNQNGRNKKRIVFEYSNRVSMMLRYDTNQGMIVMDNLVPSDPLFENDYRHYGPDFTHNAFKFEKGKWIYIENVILRNRMYK